MLQGCLLSPKGQLISKDVLVSSFRPKNQKKISISAPQIREQMSGPEISKYGKSSLSCGLWPGLDCGIKGFGPIMSTLFLVVLSIFHGQKNFLYFFFTL